MKYREPSQHRRLTHTPLFWDTLTALMMLTSLAVFAYGGMIGWIGLISFVVLLYGSFIEPRMITVNKKSIHIKGLKDITIAIIADQHIGPFKGEQYMRRIVEKTQELKPDLILLPGDFIYDHLSDIHKLTPLKDLHAPLGVFAVLGNHDTGHMLDRIRGAFVPYRTPDRSADVIELLASFNIPMLRNEHRMLRHKGQTFALAGTDHSLMDSCDLDQSLTGIPHDVPVILLSHVPDIIMNEASTRASLIVSGHTHGGQIRLPFIGAIYPIPDRLGSKFDQGLFDLGNDRTLAITHGIGETLARARLCCPPEIMMLQIENEELRMKN